MNSERHSGSATGASGVAIPATSTLARPSTFCNSASRAEVTAEVSIAVTVAAIALTSVVAASYAIVYSTESPPDASERRRPVATLIAVIVTSGG
jgi:hypothetical protein